MITSRYPLHCLLISIAFLQSDLTSSSVKSADAFTTIVQPRHAGLAINKRAVKNNALSNNPKSAFLFHPSEHSRITKRPTDTVTSLRQSDKNDDEDSSSSIPIAQKLNDLRKILAAKLISFFPTLRTAIASFTVGAIFALTVVFVPVYNSVDSMSEPVTLFETILTDLETGYVDDVDTKKLFETGVNAMLRSLDPYTEFESRQQSKDLTETIMGKYGGIGLVISGSTTKAKPVAVESSSTTISDKNGDSKILPTGAMEDNARLNDISSSANSEEDDEDLIEDEFERAAMAKQRLEDEKEAAKGIRVVNAFEGYAFDYGMRPGDKLVAIDGWRIDNGSTVEDVRNKLRGDPGSDVEITFERDGVAGENTVKIQRTIVQIQDVKLASLVGKPEDGIGYIQLAGFSADAGREMRNSIFALQQAAERASGGETSLQGLVLDLRGNPGGLLTSAVDVSSLFVPKGSDIVSARGRGFAGVTYRSRVDPILDPKTKLAVLINDSTASAAEIVSGAVQDLDVGVIVGSSRSFGKGLVQNVEDLPFNTALKFTVAKYYTPSGRCIQSVNYKEGGGSADGKYQASKVAEKDKTVYYTTNGREVKDGGGIAVDYKVDAPKASALEVTLLRSGIISDFASDWCKKNELTNNFEVDDATYNSFKTFVMKQSKDGDLKLDALYSRPIQDLKRSLAISGYKGSSRELEQLQASILNDMSKDFDKYKSDIKEDIATGILSRYLPESMLIDRSIKTDKQVLGAIKIIDDQKQFNKLLSRTEKDLKMLAKNTVEDSSFSDQNSAKINLKF